MAADNAYSEIILDAQATDETSSTVLGPAVLANKQEHTFYTEWGTGVSAGVVTIEEASDPAYAGTWANVATVTYSAGSPLSVVTRKSGAALAMRARISTAVAGGTVTVTYVGN